MNLDFKYTADGLIPAIVQDVETGDVLMMAWMDESALRATWAITWPRVQPGNRLGSARLASVRSAAASTTV